MFFLSREIKGLESHHGLQPFCFLLSVLQNHLCWSIIMKLYYG